MLQKNTIMINTKISLNKRTGAEQLKLSFLTLMLLLSSMTNTYAMDEKALRAERNKAQKQRQVEVNQRNRSNHESFAQFRTFIRELNKEVKEKTRELDTQYRIQKIELKGQRDMKMVEAETNMQKKISELLLNQGAENKVSAAQFKAQIKTHADEVFNIKKQAANEEQKEYIDNETAKHKLLTKRDKKALEKAKELGLLDKKTRILAEPIGGSLTKREEQWNEREKKEVEKIHANNKRQLVEFNKGEEIREWEINNKHEDFNLKWEKETELHALNQEQVFYNALMFQPTEKGQSRQKEMSEKIAEISKRNRMINIKYKTIKNQNRVKRSEQRRKIRGM